MYGVRWHSVACFVEFDLVLLVAEGEMMVTSIRDGGGKDDFVDRNMLKEVLAFSTY